MRRPARTLLFVPANRDRFLEKALGTDADAVLVDLEDGVPPAEKETARAALAAWAPSSRRPVWVRVNAVDSGLMDDDLAAVRAAGSVEGIMLPKVDGGAIVDELADAQRRADIALPVIPMIESARGVLATLEIATRPSVASVCFGGARGGDLHADLGSAWSSDGPELLYARQHVLLAARAAGMTWPLDGVFAEVGDADGFRHDTTLSRRLGYRGRTVIHPSQIPIANVAYAPSERELDEARRTLDAISAAERDGRGTATVDGRLVDVAMGRWARGVIELAERIAEPEGSVTDAR